MNLYAKQKDISSKFCIDHQELRKFLGILLFTSVYRFPNSRSYWGQYGLDPIRLSMTCNRFEEIRNHLHFNNDASRIEKGQPGYDLLYKIRPLVKHFNQRFSSVPMRQRLCVDEQMCATKMSGNPVRQYMPAKPHKWGAKLFVICDSFGYSYSFEVYCGAGDNKILPNCPDLGAASNVVVRLSQVIPNNANHIIYFDNFYTSLGLLLYMRSRGIHSLGTVRGNRVPNIKLSTDAELQSKKVARGYNEEYVGSVFGVDISSVLWYDTRAVRLLSTYVGTDAIVHNESSYSLKANRWDRKLKQNVEVDCPAIVKEYNQHMGGVDLVDGLIGRYHIKMKTRKWTNKLFYHMLDVSMVNAYCLYNRLNKDVLKCKLPDFRSEVAETLCLIGSTKPVKRGRPSSLTPPPKAKKTYHLSENIRYDQIGHWCKFLDRSGKKMCKFRGCKSETQAFCIKCKINLCNSTAKDCFFKYHNKEEMKT
ncbi:piggyBac transposable element-derived protein 1-like isoform X1 [Zeugodacus cucurbitae]|uniref:PiggyBac transposable element-derived protein 1 n=3 Tax=Dacini TaxID=43871 RepID=A0A0A1WEM0_ZEUCU|nr:piggyBac transposable element-derived protein 1-like isoform X1 [Zeugodacus cucurbitae]